MSHFKVFTLLGILLLGQKFQFVVLTQSLIKEPIEDTATNSTPIPSTTNADWRECSNPGQIEYPECSELDPGIPLYFPFPYDCTQYFECIRGSAECFKCANGTVWDQGNGICNYESEVNCTALTTGSAVTTSTTTPKPTTEDPAEWICPVDYIGLIRHPYDCRFFYFCHYPCTSLFQCPDNLLFNPELEVCEYPWNVPDCIDGTPPPTSPTPASTSTTSVNYRNANRYKFPKTVQFDIDGLRATLMQEECLDP